MGATMGALFALCAGISFVIASVPNCSASARITLAVGLTALLCALVYLTKVQLGG